jgi:tRNA A-37 threonylcarbamoyl transferase component Bud32
MEGSGVTGTLCGATDSAAARREIHVCAGGFRWQVAAEYADEIIGPMGLRLPEWQASGAARVIKHGPHRSVYRVVLPGLDFYVKHFRLMDARTWLRQTIRPSKARMEYERTTAVAERGVSTVQALGLGEADNLALPGESYLLTQSVVGALPLSQFIVETLPRWRISTRSSHRIQLATDLGHFMALVHRAGILHRDLHAGNILVQCRDDGLRLYLIDLHAVELGSDLPWPTRRDNLVIFDRWFSLFTDRTDRRRFWGAYISADCVSQETPLFLRDRRAGEGVLFLPSPSGRGAGGEGKASMASEQMLELRGLRSCQARIAIGDLEQRTRSSNLRFWRHRDRRCLVNNRYYRRLNGPGVRGHAVTDLPDDIYRSLLMDPDLPFRCPHATWLKDSRSSSVIEMNISLQGAPCPVIYKRFKVRSRLAPWLSLLRPTQALRSWVLGHGLIERCLPTARPLLVIERRRLGAAREAYLLTEKITNACHLHQFVAETMKLPARERAPVLRDLIESLARLVRKLHDRGLSHRDLKASNILVRREHSALWTASPARQAGPTLCLIDVVGIQRVRRPGPSRRARDVSRLQASLSIHPVFTRGDALRFLRVYLQCGFTGTVGWKNWWREIATFAEAKVKKNRRAGRPLT